MASTISISTGGMTVKNDYADDAAVQAILRRCAKRIGASGTDQEQLKAVLDWCVRMIQDTAAEQQFDDERSALLQQAQEGNQLK